MVNREGGLNPSGSGLNPDATLCSKDYTQTGVSVRYAYNPDKKWYVLRASYGREIKAYDYLISNGVQAYLPIRQTARHYGKTVKIVREPLLPNIVFAYCSNNETEKLIKFTPELFYLNYYYDHIKKSSDGKNPPLIVDYDQMTNFIMLTSTLDEHIRLIDSSKCHFKSGDRVRVTDGNFIGVEGRVARVAGQQRVVVEIDGLCTIATAYIPSAFLEDID